MPNYSTEIIVILDRSGSMNSIAAAMKASFDEFISSQRALPGSCCVTLVQFDHEHEVQYTARPLAEVTPLELVPRGNTALYDAIGRTLVGAGERLSAMAAADRPERVLVLIITDGLENASVEYSRDQVAAMVEHQQTIYSWSFSYLGANQDALRVAASINIPAGSSVTYEPSVRGTRAAGVVLSVNARAARCGAPAPDATRVYAQAFAADGVAPSPSPAVAVARVPAVPAVWPPRPRGSAGR